MKGKSGWLMMCAGATALAILPVGLALASQGGVPSYTGDSSDWWSYTRRAETDEEQLVQHREAATSNFRILGLQMEDDIFGKAAAKFGPAPKVERGDGAIGRSQICYVSVEGKHSTHLVFERGEVNEAFYLFRGGPDWKGSEHCVELSPFGNDLAVASGLRLGITSLEVTKILGKPSKALANKLIYVFEVTKKSSAADFEKLKLDHPELSEKELRSEFEYYTLSAYIEARFASGALNYLAVSKTEAY